MPGAMSCEGITISGDEARFNLIRSTLSAILRGCKLPDDSNRRNGSSGGYPSNREDKSVVPAFPFADIAAEVTKSLSHDEAISLFVDIFEYLPDFAITHPSGHLYVNAGLTKSTAVAPLVFKVFVSVVCKNVEIKSEEYSSAPKNKKSKNIRLVPRPLDLPVVGRILTALLPVDFPVEAKVWSTVIYILQLMQRKEFVGHLVSEAILEGKASFVATIFFMHHPTFSRYFETAEALRVAASLGALRASTVESFASNRTAEFRESCREVLREAENASKNHSFRKFCPSHLEQHQESLKWTAEKFEANIIALMNELRGVHQYEATINAGWAFAALKKYMKKTYVEQQWQQENLHELLWSILHQRPNLRKMIVGMLQNEYNDIEASQFWRKIDLSRGSPRHVCWNSSDKKMANPLTEVDETHLNFPSDCTALTFIGTSKELVAFSVFLSKMLEQNKEVTVALDAEWSAYQGFSAASILQVALRHAIFIVDVDEINNEDLASFMKMLFENDNILKIGFQFHEDLAQLRAAIPKCASLYSPRNLICIGKLVAALIAESKKREDGEALLEEFGVKGVLEEPKNGNKVGSQPEDEEVSTAKQAGSAEHVAGSLEQMQATSKAESRVVSRGLSALCEMMLGRPLDKTEQCSVWNRRPLRDKQLRYASMDSFCLLLLYQRCIEWAAALNVSIHELRKLQSPFSTSLPLFFGD